MEGGSVAPGRLQIGCGEQRENDSGEKDEQAKQNAQSQESGLSSVFLFHGRNLWSTLKFGFYAKSMRDVTAIFRVFLCWVESGVKPPHSKAAAATENIRVNFCSFVVKSGPRQTILR
jgi:hypothetical protein